MPNTTRALVIGGTSGIGAAVVDRLKSARHRGMEVYVPAEVRQEWSGKNVFELDVRDPYVVQEYFERNGRFDHVVYTPGINRLGYVDDYPLADLEAVMQTNFTGFVNVMRYAQRPTNTVAIVSDAAWIPMRGSLAYCASKAALAMAVRVIAREWSDGNHRVNGVAPGVVEGTPLTQYNDGTIPAFRGWSPEEAAMYEQKGLPLGRRAYVDEVAAVVESVLFGPAYQTGTIVAVNGGK